MNLTVVYLCLQGARVIIGDLQVSDGEKVAREIGDSATFVPMDVSKIASLAKQMHSLSQ